MVSSSGIARVSVPATRATAFLAWSLTRWTWKGRAAMSSIRRDSRRWAGGRFLVGWELRSAVSGCGWGSRPWGNGLRIQDLGACQKTAEQAELGVGASYCASAYVEPLERMAERMVRLRMKTGTVIS